MTAYSTELHLHSCYSLLEGASQPEELAARAAELGYRALALTDHDGLYGAMAFAQACAAVNVRPITGVELTLAHGQVADDLRAVHLTLLAETDRGYANLCRLVTLAWRDGGHRASRQLTVASRQSSVVSSQLSAVRPPDQRPETRDQPSPQSSVLSPSPALSPSLAPALLAGHTQGLIVLTGCRSGELARLVDAERFEEARALLRRLADLFGCDNVFVELQHNLVQGDAWRIARLAELAGEVGLPIVATGDVHYHVRERHRLQDALVAIKSRGTLEGTHRVRRPNSEFYLRSPEQMADVFADLPEALANAELVGERCRGFNLADRGSLGYDFPDFTRQDGEQEASADEVLAAYCRRRFEDRYPAATTAPELRAKASDQLEAELKLVGKHHLAGFFLIYRDLQDLATEVAMDVRGAGTVRGGSGLPPGRGRGSSVSSIICYLIGLSHVDPVKNRLFFRRFLNEDLQAVPDIDLDFARDIREELILRVYERYGHEHAALVCSFATYHIRSAVRDLGKVLGLPPAAIDKLARLSEGGKASSVRAELERLPELRAQAQGPLWEHLVELAAQLDGVPRHVSQHVGGMIISSRPVVELVPVQPAAMEGRFICQWDKDGCDDARFIKIDFLALGMLSLVEECLEMIWQTRGEKVDLAGLTYDDPAVYQAISDGDTVGIFQVESRAQIQMLTRTQPRTLDDLAVQVAIVRPGPIVGGAVNPYVQRREQQRAAAKRHQTFVPRADHPMLDKLLEDTLGVVLYQDQVLEVAIEMGGFSAGQADQFRRAMSRRRSLEAMERFRDAFLRGAKTKGVRAEDAMAMFDKLRAFSEFGFPKSHAYAFAVLAYQSAWLRHYYAAEYYAALLNNQPMGFYAPHVLLGDARRHAVHTLRVSINRSGVRATPKVSGLGSLVSGNGTPPSPQSSVLSPSPRDQRPETRDRERSEPDRERSELGRERSEPGFVLLGLTTVKGLGEELAEAIVAEREANGPYRSLADLLRRTDLPRSVAERLIAVGALSDFGLGRRDLLWQLGLLYPGLRSQVSGPRRRITQSSVLSPQSSRLRQQALDLPVEQDMVSLKEMDEWERMVADYGLLGLSPSYHPMGLLRPRLPKDLLTAEQLRNQTRDGQRARTAGLVVCRQRPGTAKGFLFLLLEDETGLVNVVVRPDLYEANRGIIRGEPYLCIEGSVQIRSGTLNLLANRVAPLGRLPDGLLPTPHVDPVSPDNADDPRWQEWFGKRQAPTPAPRYGSPGPDPRDYPSLAQTPSRLDSLRRATPLSHDFR